jgi:hypothetical protein
MIAKYKLGSAERMEHPIRHTHIVAYRVIALIDIPVHGVKAGDVGGYVDHKKVLSQKGDCWIGGNAFALDKSRIEDDAIVKDDAVVSNTSVEGHAAIYDRAIVSEMPGLKKSRVLGSAKIYGNAQVVSSSISGYSKVYEAAVVNRAYIMGYSSIFGYAKMLGPATSIEDSRIFGYAEIHSNVNIINSQIHCQVLVHKEADVEDSFLTHRKVIKEGGYVSEQDMRVLFKNSHGETLDCGVDGIEMTTCANLYHEKSAVAPSVTVVASEPHEINERKRLDAIEKQYADYEQDIVKLIKYPVMTDLTNTYTAAFNSALRKTRRLYEEGDIAAYKDSLDTLEDAFHIAESNARKISLSQLLADERSKVTDARQMLAVALDEASSETEKKNAFKGAMRNLEGIVAVPDAAVASLRQQIGLREIEA